MDRKMQDEISFSFWRRLTGRQDPSLKRKIASIFVALLTFFIVGVAGFFLNKSLIAPSANVVFYPFIEDHSYLPIQISNGQKPLTDITVSVKTCYMNEFKNFPVPNLIEGQEYPVHLTDEDTVFALDKVFNSNEFTCNPKNVSFGTQCYIQTYIVNGKLYAPAQECKKYRCGYCPYQIIFKSNQFIKSFSGMFPGPIEITTYKLKITPNNPLNVSKEGMIPLDGGIVGISLFSPYDLCMFDTNQNYEYCKDLPVEIIYKKPITMVISPVNKSLGNLSINISQII